MSQVMQAYDSLNKRALDLQVDGSGNLLIGGGVVGVSASFARPADTTAYAAKDAVSDSTSAPTVLTFSSVARVNGGSGYITAVRLMTDQAANTAQYRLHFFHTTPTAINDNAGCTAPLWADRAKYIGAVDVNNMGTEGGTTTAAYGQNLDIRLPFVAAAADRNIYGLLETLTAFTPASAQNFLIEIRADLN